VHFTAENHFDGSPEAVAKVLSDPKSYLDVELPDLSAPTLVKNTDDGTRSEILLRYEYVGHLDPIARRLLGGDELAWMQQVVVDRKKLDGSLEFGAEKDPKRLHGSATFVLEPDPGGGTVRRLEGDLVVDVIGVGHMAERHIVPGIVKRLDIETEAVNNQLQKSSNG